MRVINLAEARINRTKEVEKRTIRTSALSRVQEHSQSDSAKFNYDFYCLIDLFMSENYPDYLWRFNVWVDKIGKD